MSGTVFVPNNDPAAIESGNSWNGLDTVGAPVIVSFSFPTSLPAYDESIGGFTPAAPVGRKSEAHSAVLVAVTAALRAGN